MADMEAVDAAATQSVKRLREDDESNISAENPEKKLRLLEEIDGELKEAPSADVGKEQKLDAEIEAEGEAKEKQEELEAKENQEEVEAEPAEQEEEAGTASKVDEEMEADVEPQVDLPGESKDSGQPSEAKVGPKLFHSSLDMFNFFYGLLHSWPLNVNLNKYEHLMLVDLLNQGHSDPEKKKGTGIDAFQVRVNPDFHSRCFYIVRTDGSAEDFSYRKCVDNILPLPEDLKARSGDLRLGNKKKGGGHWNHHEGRGGRGGGGRGGRRGGGHGRGNRGRRGRF